VLKSSSTQSALPNLNSENSQGDTVKKSHVKTMDPFRRSNMASLPESVRQRLSSSELLLMPASPLSPNSHRLPQPLAAPILRENFYLNNHDSGPAHLLTPPPSAENPSDDLEDDISDEGDTSSKDEGMVYKEYCQVCGSYERQENDAPHGEIQLDLGLCDVELCIIKTKDLNNLLKSKNIPKNRAAEIKERRRTLKNRGYASSSRDKKTLEDTRLEREKERLIQEVKMLDQEAKEVEMIHLGQEVERERAWEGRVQERTESDEELLNDIFYNDFGFTDEDLEDM